MAKAKKTIASRLPKGFKAITGFGSGWQPKKAGDALTGVYRGSKVVKWKDKQTGKQKSSPVHKIETDSGVKEVFESAGLRALGEVRKGQKVAIVFLGQKKIPGGRKFNDYEIGVM